MSNPAPLLADDAVLRVRNLRTEYHTRDGVIEAVRDVSFELGRGERIGIVGESGSGKSALALSILRLIESPGRVVGGDVSLNGRIVSTLSERGMDRVRGREVSLILQDPMTALDPVMTVGDQIVEAIRRHQEGIGRSDARRRAVELLREVDISNADRRLGDYPHQYSGGMRQRVMIAIALANNPDVLIADEPTTALDVTTQAQVLDLLERLVEEHGTAVILITHNLGVVAEFCERVAVMYAGRFVETAATGHVFSSPTHPYTEALLACVPHPGKLAQGRLPAIPGFPPNLARLPDGCSFEPRCPLGHGREVCLRQAPIPPTVVEGPAGAAAVECHFARERAPAGATT